MHDTEKWSGKITRYDIRKYTMGKSLEQTMWQSMKEIDQKRIRKRKKDEEEMEEKKEK